MKIRFTNVSPALLMRDEEGETPCWLGGQSRCQSKQRLSHSGIEIVCLVCTQGCYDTMLSHGGRTVKSQRSGERGSGIGGGADSSCLSVSLETDCIKQTLNGQATKKGEGKETFASSNQRSEHPALH